MSDDSHRRPAIADGHLPRQRRVVTSLFAVLVVAVLSVGATLSYYVDALWFESLGYSSVFWTRLNFEAATFGVFALLSFLVIYGAFFALKPARLDVLVGGTIFINRQRLKTLVHIAGINNYRLSTILMRVK